jgi:hypothetical protein
MPRHRKFLVASLAMGLAVTLGTATAVYATSLPGGTTVTAALKTGTDMTFQGNIDSVSITVSCTTFTGSATLPNSPASTIDLNGPPTLSGCTDTSGGSDTVTTNSTSGPWVLSTKGKKAPYKLTLTIPKAGATFASNVIPGCVITAAPKKPVKVTGKYDGTNTDTVSNGKIATKGAGCTSTTAETDASVVFSPSPGPPPF